MTKVIVFSPNQNFIDSLKRDLISSFEFIPVYSDSQLIASLRNADLVIIDFKSHDVSQQLSLFKLIQNCADQPVLAYVSAEQEALGFQAKEFGAYDFLLDFDSSSVMKRMMFKAIEWRKLTLEHQKSLKAFEKESEKGEQREKIYRSLAHEFLENHLLNHKEIIRNFSRILSATRDLNEIVQLSLGVLKDYLNISRIGLFLDEQSTGQFLLCGSIGISEEFGKNFTLNLAKGLPFHLAQEGIIIRKESSESFSFNQDLDVQREMAALQCEFALPLFVKGKLVGVLVGNKKVSGQPFSDSELEFLFSLCSQIAIGVENARLYSELSYQNQYLECILNDVSSGVLTVDRHQRILTLNPKAKEILRVGEMEFIDQSVNVLPNPIPRLLLETLDKATSLNRAEIILQSNQHPLGVSTSQLKGKQGEVLGCVMVFADLTLVRKQSVLDQQEAHMEFVQKVAMRSSHELKNCLVSIRTFTQLLPDKYSDKEFRTDFYTIVNHEVDRLAILVDNLNFFAQNLDLLPMKENLEAILDDGVSLIPKEDRKNILIQKDLLLESLEVIWDTENMKRAFFNIFRNSVQAMGKGGHLNIKVQEVEPGLLSLEFSDEGYGMPIEECAHVFDPFFTTKSRGIGLGLTISRKIIEAHGGTVSLESQPSRGTIVKILIPRKVSQQQWQEITPQKRELNYESKT